MFFQNFKSAKDVENEFQSPGCLEKAEVVFAYYSYENYSGSALVIYSQDGKLYEVNGGHCSCNGLEGQWSPEETSISALMLRYQRDTDDEKNAPYEFRECEEGRKALKYLKEVLVSNEINKLIMAE